MPKQESKYLREGVCRFLFERARREDENIGDILETVLREAGICLDRLGLPMRPLVWQYKTDEHVFKKVEKFVAVFDSSTTNSLIIVEICEVEEKSPHTGNRYRYINVSLEIRKSCHLEKTISIETG